MCAWRSSAFSSQQSSVLRARLACQLSLRPRAVESRVPTVARVQLSFGVSFPYSLQVVSAQQVLLAYTFVYAGPVT